MNKFMTTTDIIYNSNTKNDIVIAHISDIHFSNAIKPKLLNKMEEYLINMHADYIMITGDTIDYPEITNDKEKIKELVNFLTNLGKNTKVLISLGNHDVMTNHSYRFFEKLNDIDNVYVLNNNSYQDKFIYVSGFTLSNDYYYNITREESSEILLDNLENNKLIIENLPKNLPKVALIHSPIKLTDKRVLNKLHEYNLILCGHTHNGLVPRWLYWLFRGTLGFVGPNNRLFPKVAKGKIKNGNTTIIINGGITKFSEESGLFSKIDFIYNKIINKIIIRKEEKNEN